MRPSDQNLFLSIGFGIFGAFICLLYLKRESENNQELRRQLTGKMLFRNFKTVLYEHILIVNQLGMLIKTEFADSRLFWQTLLRVEPIPGYSFLYLNGNDAFILPHESLIEGLLKAIESHNQYGIYI